MQNLRLDNFERVKKLSLEGRFKSINVPIIKDERLRECNYGKLNGGPSSIVESMCEKECIYDKFTEGESYEDVKVRIADFLNFLKTR